MKRTPWLWVALAAATLLLAACGATLDGAQPDADATVMTLRAPDETIPGTDPDFDAMLDPDYWEAEGPYDICWIIAPDASDDDYVLDYTPPGYTWLLGVVTKGEAHYLFANPVEGDVFETDGYDQVIACKNETPPDEEGLCSLTQGYWKTHSSYGPAPYDVTWELVGEDTPFFASGTSHIDVMWTAPRGNAYYILAHQYIAAKLNEARGADVSAVADELAAAQAWFETYGPVGLDRDQQAAAKALAETLDAYNNGLIGPGHCSN